jgi:hypothetical protein
VTGRLDAALAAVDAANAEDPTTVLVDGAQVPRELAHGIRVAHWVRRLDPDAGEAQVIAARASHLRRWTHPRSEHPEGRAGYLRWRTAAKRRHAEEVEELLVAAGYGADAAGREVVARVQALIRKEGLGRDPDVQVHEDALCLTFLESQLDDVAASLGDARTVDVLVRTLAKMSPAAIAEAGRLALSDAGHELLALAVDRWRAVPPGVDDQRGAPA